MRGYKRNNNQARIRIVNNCSTPTVRVQATNDCVIDKLANKANHINQQINHAVECMFAKPKINKCRPTIGKPPRK